MGVIRAKVISFEEGLMTYEDVDMIRIVSDRYNLLIMKDFMPVLGDVRGTVEIVSGDRCESYEGVNGYFIHSGNEFELLVLEESYAG